ncbi:MAG: hypothetical protein U1C51_06335, partial [Candidatus Izemoplasmatales bacterium]|nr:hypothetical protein [Candidatus Izemoplasmatales bacterium]
KVSPYLQEGSIFYGWYMDDAYSILYQSKSEIESIILYGYTEMKTYDITFYDFLGNVFETKQVSYGSSLEEKTEPTFPKSPWLTFTFLGWDKELSNISTNMDVFPLFDVTFQSTSIQLKPGIDTVLQHANWMDAGVNVDDSLIRLQVLGEVDSKTPGKYTIVYELYFQEQKLSQITRMVRVVEVQQVIKITLNPGISTIIKGQEYIEAGAKSTGNVVEIFGSVNTEVTGIYPIVYRVVTDTQVVQVTRFVHVIEKKTSDITVLWWYKKSEVMVDEA